MTTYLLRPDINSVVAYITTIGIAKVSIRVIIAFDPDGSRVSSFDQCPPLLGGCCVDFAVCSATGCTHPFSVTNVLEGNSIARWVVVFVLDGPLLGGGGAIAVFVDKTGRCFLDAGTA